MTRPPHHLSGWRRLALWLVVPLLSATGAVAVAAPAQAAVACEYRVTFAADAPTPTFGAVVTIRNTGPTQVTGWAVLLAYEPGVTVESVFNMRRSTFSTSVYLNPPNSTIPPGEAVTAGLTASKTDPGLSNLPQGTNCSV